MTNLQFYCGHSLCAGTPYQSCSLVFLAIKHCMLDLTTTLVVDTSRSADEAILGHEGRGKGETRMKHLMLNQLLRFGLPFLILSSRQNTIIKQIFRI